MEQEVKDFILRALENAYSNARDNYARALLQFGRTRAQADERIMIEYEKTMQTAKQALAYFGVYR